MGSGDKEEDKMATAVGLKNVSIILSENAISKDKVEEGITDVDQSDTKCKMATQFAESLVLDNFLHQISIVLSSCS